jgi:hypothetical protein
MQARRSPHVFVDKSLARKIVWSMDVESSDEVGIPTIFVDFSYPTTCKT